MPAEAFNRRLIAPLILGSVLNPINSSILAVSLVPIGHAFGASSSAVAWLVTALYVATAIGQPLAGRLIDLFGPRPLFLTGAALTGIAGVLGALAPSLPVLVASRVILGLGTCAGYPAAMYLIRSEAERTGQDSPGGILTALAVSAQTIVVIGPSLGGLLIAVGGWRMTLAVNIPLSAACLLLGLLRLPRTPPRRAEEAGGTDLLGVFRGNPALLRTYARTLLAMTVSYAFLYGFTQWVEDARGLSPSLTGLVLLPMSLTAIVVSSLTGRSPALRRKLLIGALAQLVACLLLLVLDAGSAIWLLFAIATLMGIPQGLLSLANQNAVYRQAEARRIGTSAGLLRTFAYLGAIGASAATGALFGSRADTSGMHELTMLLVVVAVALVALTLLDRSLRAGPPTLALPIRDDSKLSVQEEPR